MQAGRRRVIGPATSPRNMFASTQVTGRRESASKAAASEGGRYNGASRLLCLPLPAGKLFAERDFLEFADARSRNRFHKHESIRHLPTGKRLPEKLAQFMFSGAGA